MTTVSRIIDLIPDRPGGGMGVEERAQRSFTLRLWSSLWIERGGWEGRLSETLRSWALLDPSASIQDTFAAALGGCDPEALEELSETQRGELYRVKYSHCPPEDRREGAPLQRLEALLQKREVEKRVEGHWLQDSTALRELSLLRNRSALAIDPNLLPVLFGGQSSARDLKGLLEYVQAYAAGSFDSLFRIAYSDVETLVEINALGEQEGQRRAIALSEATAKEIAQLGIGQRRLIFGKLLGRSPKIELKVAADTFYSRALSLLSKDPEQLAKEITEKVVREMGPLHRASEEWFTEETCEKLRGILQDGIAQFLFPALSRSLLKDRSLGAKILLAPIELLRFGTFKGLSLVCEWMTSDFSTYLSQWLDKETLQELYSAMVEGRLQDLLRTKLQNFFHEPLSRTREEFLKMVSQCAQVLPSYASDLIQLLGYGDFGEAEQSIWLEVERQPNGRFALSVFAEGMAASHFHPSQKRGGGTASQTLIQYCDIEPKQLDAEFFHAFYSYQIAPKEGQEYSYRLSHLYEGLLRSLKAPQVDLSEKPHAYSSRGQGGPWGVMCSFLRYHLALKTEAEEEAFLFGLQQQALLDTWQQVEKDPKFFPSMWKSSQALIESALSRFAKEELTLDALRRLYATVWEISSATRQVQASSNKKPMVLPRGVAHHLQGLFSAIPSDLAQTVQDLLIGAVGPQAEAAIAAIREELAPALPISSPTWTQRAKRFGSVLFEVVLGVSISDFNSPYYASYIKIAFLVARIALTIFYPAMGITLNGIALAAFFVNYTMGEIFHALFSGVMRTFSRAKYRFFGSLFARTLLGQEGLRHFQALVHYWSGVTLRTSAVSYELPSTHSPAQRKELFFAPLEVPPALRSIGPTFLTPKKENITSSNVASCLQRWLRQVEGREMSDEVNLYLNAQMKQLPVPLAGDFWAEVSQIRSVLEDMASLAFALYKSAYHSRHLSDERKEHTKIHLYKAYAIIDVLARRCPESKLDGFLANGWALSDWHKEVFFRVYDRDLYQQLTELQNYFGIDPDADIEEEGKRSLFFASPGARLNSVALENYLEQFLDDPTISAKLAVHGIQPDDFYVDRLHMLHADPSFDAEAMRIPLQEREELEKLFLDEGRNPRKGILPRPFHLLRFANLLANHFMHNGAGNLIGAGGESLKGPDDALVVLHKPDNVVRELLHMITFKTAFHKQKQSALDHIPRARYVTFEVKGVESAWTPLLKRSISWDGEMKATGRILSLDSYLFPEVMTNFLHSEPRTQYAVIRDVPSFTALRPSEPKNAIEKITDLFKGPPDAPLKSGLHKWPPSERCVVEMIHTFSSEEQPMRALAYFEQKLDELKKPEFLLLLRALLLQSDALASYLERFPQFAKTLGEFFTRAIHYHERNLETSLSLIEIAIYARAEVETASYFPDLRALLLERKGSFVARQLLALPWLFVDPESASSQQIEEALFDIAMSRNIVGEWRTDLLDAGEDLFWKWRPAMQEALDRSPSLRDRVLHAIAVDLELLAQEGPVSHWEGFFPIYSSGGLVVNLLKKEGVEHQTDAAVRHEIKHKLHEIFGSSIPEIRSLHRGIYAIPSQEMGVELQQDHRLAFFKMHEGKKFYWMREGASADPSLTYWMNVTHGLLILKNGHFKEMRPVRQQWDEVFEILQERMVVQGEECEEIDLSVEQHGLGPLTWASPEIRAYRSLADRHRVRRIEFTTFGIAFNVEGGNAMGEGALSGLLISPEQMQEERYPTLGLHARYLLLQNKSGAHKVLLPSDTLYSAAASWILKLTAQIEISRLIESMIDTSLRSDAKDLSSRYYLYDIDERGHLVNSDPRAMLHLLCYHLAQGSLADVHRDLRILESLGRRKPFSSDLQAICMKVALAAFGMDDPEVSHVALCLGAIVEENRQIQGGVGEGEKEALLSWVALQGNYYLHCIRGQQKIDEYQELWILRGIIDRAKQLLSQGEMKGFGDKFMEKLGTDFAAETFLVHPQIADRYEFLQKKYGLEKRTVSVKGIARSLVWEDAPSIPRVGALGISRRAAPSAISWITSILRKKNSVRDLNFTLFEVTDFNASWDTVPLSASHITSDDWIQYMHAYYLLARGILPKGDEREKLFEQRREQLMRMLHLISGRSFGPAIDAWIAVLQLTPFSSRFPTASTLENVLQPHSASVWKERLEREFRKAFHSISLTMSVRQHLPSFARSFTHNWGARAIETGGLAYASSFLEPTGVLLPLSSVMYRGYKAYSRAIESSRRALREAGALRPIPAEEAPFSQEMSDFLASEDAPLAAVMSSLLERHCIRSSALARPQEKIAPFEVQESPIIQHYFARLNQSIGDFYARETSQTEIYRPRDLNHFYQLGADLRSAKETLGLWLETFQDELIAFAKRRTIDQDLSDGDVVADLVQEMKQESQLFDRDLYLRELIWAFGREDRKWLSLHTQIRPKQMAEFEKMVARYLIHATRLHQLERAEQRWQEASLDSAADIHFAQLSFELTRKRAYAFDGPAARLVRGNLLFEYGTKMMLWEKQVQKLQEMLLGKDPRVVLELITGMGKSSYGIPITSFFGADKSRAIYNIFPDSLAEEHTEQVSTRSALAFGQPASMVKIDRNKTFDEKTLWALLVAYQRMVQRGEQFNGRKKDLQALELCFIEAAHYSQRDFLPDQIKQREKELFYFMQILSTLRQHVTANVDEAHRGFRRNEELNHPLGVKKLVQKNFVRILMASALQLTADEAIAAHVRLQSGRPAIVPPSVYHAEIKPRLAEKMFRRFAIPESKRNLFVQYLSGASTEVPSFVLTHPKRREIGLVVGILNKILPDALQRRIFVDYGPSKQGNGEYARPYSGNDSPIEQSTIKNPHEAILKTCIQFLHTRLTQVQVKKFVLTLQQEAEAEKKTAPVKMTQIERSFAAWCEHRSELSEFTEDTSEEKWAELTALLNLSDAAVLAYAEYCVIPDITYFPHNLRSDSHNFASMFSSFYSGTASPNRDGTFPMGTQVLWDKGTAGEFVDFVCTTCNHPSALCELENDRPIDCLAEVLAKQFRAGLPAKALIDAGAFFAGLSNETVVREMLDFIARERPDLEGVVFFNAEQKLVIWEKGADLPIPLVQSSIPSTRRLTYFDQIHTFGADIPQSPGAHGVLTLGSTTTLEELSQGGGRMRGLKTLGQKLVIAVQSTTKQKISKDQPLSIRDIITFVQRNEASLQGQENYLAAYQKISDIIRRAVLDAMIFAPSAQEMMKYFNAFRTLLISRTEDDPFMLYGLPEAWVFPREALGAFKKAQFARLQSSELSFPLERIWKELEPIGSEENFYPERVLASCSQNKMRFPAHDLGISQEVAQQRDQEQQVQQELEQDIEISTDLPKARGRLRLQPAIWDPDIDYFANANWLKVVPLHQKADHRATLHAVVHSRPDFSPIFRGRMWWTNNFLGILEDGSISSPFSRLQKPILELLIVRKYMPDGSVRTFSGAIDQHEAHFWREKFAQDRSGASHNPRLKIALYDLSLQTIIDTGKNGLSDEELHQDDAFLTDLVRWKFLAGHTALYRGLDQGRDQKLFERGQAWVAQHGKEKMRNLFLSIYEQQGIQKFRYSHMDILLREEDPEETGLID